jgi:hypothetical protein
MLITYRSSGWRALLGLAAVLTAGLFAVVAAVALVVIAAAMGVVGFLARAVLPMSRRHRTPPPPTPWPQETIEATVVNPQVFDERDSVVKSRRAG